MLSSEKLRQRGGGANVSDVNRDSGVLLTLVKRRFADPAGGRGTYRPLTAAEFAGIRPCGGKCRIVLRICSGMSDRADLSETTFSQI